MANGFEDVCGAYAPRCSIEHHATLFALLAKHAIEMCGEPGKKAILDGVTDYAFERGHRMAKRAVGNGDKPDLVNFLAYGEWRADPGTMNTGTVRHNPTFVSYTDKCAWNDVWVKHGLQDYGRYYCLTVDDALFRGFNSVFSANVMSNLTWGADKCVFDWGIALSDEDVRRLEIKKAELGESCIRSFDYHAAHLISTMGNELVKRLGDDGSGVIMSALASFKDMFGEAACEAVLDCASMEFGWAMSLGIG